jgi:hypothetical protein
MFSKKYILVFWGSWVHLYQVDKLSDLGKREISNFAQNSLLRWPYGTHRVHPCDDKPVPNDRLHGKYPYMFVPDYIDGTDKVIKGWESYYKQ